MKESKYFRWLISGLALIIFLACNPFALSGGTEIPTTPESIDAEQIAALVEDEVTQQLAQQSPIAPTLYDELLAGDTALESRLIALYARANPAVVYIVVGDSSGSGFVYNDEGYIVTNNHVVDAGRSYEVVFADGTRTFATLMGSDADSDLAVLQVDDLPEDVVPLTVEETDALQVGQFVVAIGNPYGEQGSMSLGIVSGLGRSLPSQRVSMGGSTYSLPQVIQTDAPINPGNSGGPLLNLEGEVVGVNAAIASISGTGSGVGFSIPAAAVRRIVPVLIEEGEYTYPYMGVSFDGEITLEEQEIYALEQTKGAYVVDLVPDGPGDTAGLIAADPQTGQGGDLIVALDDQPVNDFADLNSYLSFHTSVGQTIEVTVLRGAETVTLPLTLGARP